MANPGEGGLGPGSAAVLTFQILASLPYTTAMFPALPPLTSCFSVSLRFREECGWSDVTQHLGVSKGLGVSCPDSQCRLSLLVFNGPVSPLTSLCYLQGCVDAMHQPSKRYFKMCMVSNAIIPRKSCLYGVLLCPLCGI